MPVSTEFEKPPAKCCKFCDESTQGVDGPVSWRLTLDQDLIDTLRGSFPSWFSTASLATDPPLASSSPTLSLTDSSICNNSFDALAVDSTNSSSSSVSSSSTSLHPGSSSTSSSNFAISSSSPALTRSRLLSSSPPLLIYTNSTLNTNIQHNKRILYKNLKRNYFTKRMAHGHRPNKILSSEPPLLHIVDRTDKRSSLDMDSIRQSPPKAIVDSSPLQSAMDKNKESLKVKLLVRRPINELVEQGIMPPLKTSPAIHEQRKQLERAKTGDLLKAKIQQRPDRQELERRHILEHDEINVDPSLAEKQRMLKKARLADQLNSQISHRPGPLELIKKNILHTEEPIERIVKEGLVSFKATSEGLLNRPQHPNSYETFEEDSQSSEGDQRTSPAHSDVLEVAAASAGIVTVALTIPTSGGAVVVTSAPVLHQANKFPILTTSYTPPPPPPPLPIKQEIKSETPQRFAELCQSVVGTVATSPTLVPIGAVPSPISLGSTTSTLSPLSSVASPQSTISTIIRSIQSPQPIKSDAPGKDKHRKKSKSKPTTKARPIKFHEYKGPPNAQKAMSQSQIQSEETSYQLLLKQQNFLLEYLEGLHKHPNILPANQKPIMTTETNFVNNPNSVGNTVNVNSLTSVVSQSMPSPAPSVASSSSTTVTERTISDLSKLEKMKVSDLKNLLKKRNLPVSGPKPQLIERLKPFLSVETGLQQGKVIDVSAMSESGEMCDIETMNSPQFSPESDHELMDVVQQVDSPISVQFIQQPSVKFVDRVNNDDLLREQQRKIDELQRKLKESQEELLQMKQNQTVVTHDPAKEQPMNHKLIFKQQLEAKIQKEKMQQIENLQRQQKEYLANQQVLKSSKNNIKNASNSNNALDNGINNPDNMKIIANSTPHQTIILPKEEAPALAFNENALQHLANKSNVEILWNGESTLFLVGPLQNKKLVNGHQRAASMPSILVPITTAPDSVMAKVEMESASVKQEPSQSRMETINLESHATATENCFNTEDQPPPLHLNLQNNIRNGENPEQLENDTPISLNKKDDETNFKKVNQSLTTINRPGKRVHRNSQMMTDVLEILIKNGDLPESAAQIPITPTTPDNVIYTTENPIFNNANNAIALQNAFNGYSVNIVDSSKGPQVVLNKNEDHNIQDSSLLSPMPNSSHLDCDGDPAKALDIFLNEHHQMSSPSNGMESNTSNMEQKSMTTDLCNKEEMGHFDDLEFMTLMKLDMDIGEDSCQHQPTLHNDLSTIARMKMNNSTPLRRNMDASLQPSLNEIIQEQQQLNQQNNYNGYSNSMEGLRISFDNNGNADGHFGRGENDNNGNTTRNNNNQFMDTPMDIEEFSNSLTSFDFPSFHSNGNGMHSSSSLTNSNNNISDINIGGITSNSTSTTNNEEQLVGGGFGLPSVNSGSTSGFSSGLNSLGDNLNTDSVGLLYESHLPMNHDYNLELFDDFRIPTSDSMSWNEMDFPIFGK